MSKITHTVAHSEKTEYETWYMHMDACGVDRTERNGDITSAYGMYAFRDNVLLGTYNHATGVGTFDLV